MMTRNIDRLWTFMPHFLNETIQHDKQLLCVHQLTASKLRTPVMGTQ